MRQRYNETNWDLDYLTDDPSPRFVGQKIGAKLIPPTLFLFFKDLNNGKYKRRKMPIRDFADNVGAQQLTSDEVAQNLVTRHDVLAIVPRERLVSLLEKIRTHGGTLDKSRKVLKSIEPLPKLPSKMGPPPIYKESDKNVKGSKGNAGDLKVPIDGSVNLNKFSDDALSKVKSKMDVDFVKHQVKPGDARFQYDKQKSFGPPIEDNEWDEQSGSSKSKRVLEPKSKPAFGDLETDNSTDASNIDDELSALLGDDLEKPNVNDKSFQNDRDEESGAASKSAFWWMKKDGDEDDSKSDALSKVTVSFSQNKSPTISIKKIEKMNFIEEAPEISSDIKPKTILATSGLSATLKALQQSKNLLSNGRTVVTATVDRESDSINTVEKLSDLPPLLSMSKPASLAPIQKFSSSENIEAGNYNQVKEQAKTDTILNIDDDLEIDAGFADYNPDDDDFLSDFLPKKKPEPILPVSMPKSPANAKTVELSEVVIKETTASGTMRTPLKLDLPVPLNLDDDPFYTPINEDFGEMVVNQEDDDLSYLKKSPTSPITEVAKTNVSQIEISKPAIKTDTTKADPGMEAAKTTELSKPNSNKEFQKPHTKELSSIQHSEKDLKQDQQTSNLLTGLGPLPSLLSKKPLLSSGLNKKIMSDADNDSMPFDNDENDIPEDFDFDDSVSALLEDNEDKPEAKTSSPAVKVSGISLSALKDKIPRIGLKANKEDEESSNALKMLKHEADAIFQNYDEDFGAGDTDSEGIESGVSVLANQSPAFRIKTRDVKFEESDDEFDDLFKDDGVELEVDESLGNNANDSF